MQFADVPDRLAVIQGRIESARKRGGHGQDVRIVAVTKTHGPEAVLAAMAAGLSDVGENKVQEAIGKQVALEARAAETDGAAPNTAHSPAVRWHLIGHLQRNKVKFLDRFSLFHAVDSPRLADAIAEQGERQRRAFEILLEVNVSGEASKGGYGPDEVRREAGRLRDTVGLTVRGVMTMAPLDADEAMLRLVFAGARDARDACLAAGLPAHELSMGMSGDFEIAVEEGATMIRLGTILFGERGQ